MAIFDIMANTQPGDLVRIETEDGNYFLTRLTGSRSPSNHHVMGIMLNKTGGHAYSNVAHNPNNFVVSRMIKPGGCLRYGTNATRLTESMPIVAIYVNGRKVP